MPRARVLVADDSQTSLVVVKDLLEANGFEVVAARDGLEAMNAAYRDCPDVVLLDVVMPRMTGYQVCRMLKLDETTSQIPVIMLTSRDQPADQYWGLQTGADGYVTKEQPLQMVLETVEAALAKRVPDGERHPATAGRKPANAVDLLSRLNSILDRKLYEATILGELSKLAWSATDLEKTAREIMELFSKLFDFQLAGMLICGDKAGTAELLWMVRSPISSAAIAVCEKKMLSAIPDRSSRAADPAELNRRTVYAPGVQLSQNDDSREPGPFFSVTLGADGIEGGVFGVWGNERMLGSKETSQLMTMLANAAYVVLDNSRLYNEMHRLATTDGLTGLTNYRRFQEELEREFQRSRRTGEPMAALMMDLDNFKSINDEFGHKVGDQVLQSVGAAFMASARQYDLVARYGGEEFAVLLPGTGAKGAVEMGERLRLLVRTVGKRLKLERLSTSVGVAVYPGGGIADAQGVMREADAALYRAKAEGKDRVRLAVQS